METPLDSALDLLPDRLSHPSIHPSLDFRAEESSETTVPTQEVEEPCWDRVYVLGFSYGGKSMNTGILGAFLSLFFFMYKIGPVV